VITAERYDVLGLTQAMRRGLAEDLRQRGLERARLFSWESAARETMQICQRVLP